MIEKDEQARKYADKLIPLFISRNTIHHRYNGEFSTNGLLIDDKKCVIKHSPTSLLSLMALAAAKAMITPATIAIFTAKLS